MGGYGARILNYNLYMGDYVFEYVKENQPFEYYNSYKINVELTIYNNNEKPTIEALEIPLTEFGNIVLKRKYYKFDIDWDKFSIHRILYNILKSRKIPIIGEICLKLYTREVTHRYYLQSNIGEDNVVLSNYHYKIYPIMSYDDFIWMWKNGLDLENF